MNARTPFILPFAVLAALVAGCSSSSTTTIEPVVDSGKDTNTPATDAGNEATTTDSGADAAKDAVTPNTDASTIIPVTGSVQISNGLTQVLGITDDNYLVYYDPKTLAITVADVTGKTTIVAPGPTTDGGAGPQVDNVFGDYVAYFLNYTTKTVSGQSEIESGDLYVWSSALGTSQKIATASGGILGVSNDNKYLAFSSGATAGATIGDIGVVAAASITAPVNLLTAVSIDLSSTTCAPYVLFDGTFAVISSCATGDAADQKPSISSFNGATTAWTQTVLQTDAFTSNPYNETGTAVNFTADTSGVSVLTVSGTTGSDLNIQPVGSATQTAVSTTFGPPTKTAGAAADSGGTTVLYLNDTATFALYSQPNGALGKTTFGAGGTSNPTFVPAGGIVGLQLVSPDQKYDIDYNTALDTNTGAPTTLNLRNLATGTATSLFSGGLASSFGANSFTQDNTYLLYTTNLSPVQSTAGIASVGTLYTANLATGAINHLVTTPAKVWDASPLVGTNIVYNTNYIVSLYDTPNGAATADLYTADAATAAPGTMITAGADANYYVSKDGKYLFYSFSQVAPTGDGGTALAIAGDGVFVVAVQ